VWRFQNFSITQILREINFRDFRNAKSAILPHLEALDFDFYAFLKVELTKLAKFGALKMAKTSVFEPLDWPKLISRNI